MNRMYNISMTITADRLKVLEVLRANLEQHKKIVEEARVGYFEAAQKMLRNKLDEMEKAGPNKVVQLTFSLRPPKDHTAEYETVIRMLEMHREQTVELSADEVRQLIENKWDWMKEFVAVNEVYSPLLRAESLRNET